MLTKGGYIELAHDLRIDRNHIIASKGPEELLIGFDMAINTFCDFLKRDNRNFDRDRFWEAVKRA